MVFDSERLKALHVAKLRSVAKEHLGAGDIEAKPSPFGAVGISGVAAYALLEQDAELGLGSALAFALQKDARELYVLASSNAGVVARQATYFDFEIGVFELGDAAPIPAQVAAFEGTVPLASEAEEFLAVLTDAGVDVVVEHGVLRGEIMGLEVARVVTENGDTRLEVGVGRNDREAFSMLYQHMSADEALAKVVATVSEHRRPGAENHALNLMAVERWLRAILVAHPALVDASELAPLAPVLPRAFVDSAGPAAAEGRDLSGSPIVMVCSVGIDLSLVPLAADLRARTAAESTLQIVLPQRDVHPMTTRLLGLLHERHHMTPIADNWRDRGSRSVAVR